MIEMEPPTTYILPVDTSPWQPINLGMSPREFALYKRGMIELAEREGVTVRELEQSIAEVQTLAQRSAALDNKITRERRELANARERLELSNLTRRLDHADSDIADTSRSIEMANYPQDMGDPRNLPSTPRGYEEPRWQAERRAEQVETSAKGPMAASNRANPTPHLHRDLDAASFNTRSGGVPRHHMGDPNLHGAPEHTDTDEANDPMISYTYMDGNSSAEAFVEQHGWKLQAGKGAGK